MVVAAGAVAFINSNEDPAPLPEASAEPGESPAKRPGGKIGLERVSGGAAKDTDGLLSEIRQIRDGGATGSIIGRNSFQRPRDEALALLDSIVKIYKGQG